MEVGFVGLGNIGSAMARRLIAAEHQLVVYDTRSEAVHKLVAAGAKRASSPKDVADRVETVMASLPSLQASLDVATGKGGVIEGKKVKRFIDLSTVGSQMAVKIHGLLAKKKRPPAAAKREPSGDQDRQWTRCGRPFSRRSSFALAGSQTVTSCVSPAYSAAQARARPSARKARALT